MPMALPSQLNARDFAMVQEHNTDYEKKTENSVVNRPNINENVAVGKSHQLANVALQSHEQGQGKQN
jgi:hypothetical protein